MSEVFISYAHSTARQARGAAEALRALGYSVWLDDDLTAHRAFAHEIEQQLTAAKAALVIWSADAAMSEWVLSEANRAREAHKLVQLTIDGARLPMPFDQIQCANLAGWSGDANHPGWTKVVTSVADLVRGSAQSRAAPPAVPVPAAEPLLAVLAFDNLSGDPEMAYFSDGVSEEILQTIAHTTRLTVIGRGSSFQYRGRDKAAGHVGRSLNATHVLDGAVRRSGAKVRVSAQLVECAGETTLWSGRFERELSDIFALQDEIAASVAAGLEVVFTRPKAAGTISPAAYDMYLKVLRRSVGKDDITAAEIIRQLEEVTRLAPGFARAWAHLARTRAELLRYGSSPEPYKTMRAKIVEAADTALRLDPGVGVAYQALAALEPFGRYAAREAHIKKGLAAAPNDPEALGLAALFFCEVGRVRAGLARAKRAFELDPMRFGAAYWYASFLDCGDRYDDARALWDAFLAQWPESGKVAGGAIMSAIHHRDWDRVARLTEVPHHPESLQLGPMLLYARALRDRDARSLSVALKRAEEELAQTGTLSFDWLTMLSGLGLTNEAFGLFERASFAYMSDQEQPWASGSRHGSILFNAGANRAVMGDARFPSLCAKLGLCDYWVETGKWPDCADEVPYDFRAEARRLVGAAKRTSEESA